MVQTDPIQPEAIRAARAEHPKLRARDLAQKLNISEAQLVAADVGQGVRAIHPHPDRIMVAVPLLGEVMALTRNESCVNEKVGIYDNYRSGTHASMVLTEAIDLRIFPAHWQYAFAVEHDTESGVHRSLQVFDNAGDAVHKIHLRETSHHDQWQILVDGLALPRQHDTIEVATRMAVEAPKADPAKAETLRTEWAKMTDTHQFLRLCSKLKMNRLGAYRIAGAPLVRALRPQAVEAMLQAVMHDDVEVMVFVGNRGCIQIHNGPIRSLKPVGPWQNVMDPDFNLHLRADHVAEVWAVEKPTQRGPALSVEAFGADGSLIFQVFPVSKEGRDNRPAWRRIVESLPDAAVARTETEVA